MAKSISQQDMHTLALVGAKARLEGLQAEVRKLLTAFPELARGGRAASAGSPRASAPRRRKRSYTMSAEQKRAVSERMKKYWAARRKEKGK